MRLGLLPPPDAVAAQVGTQLWLPPRREPIGGYASRMAHAWDELAVRRLVAASPDLRFQEPRYQTPWKVSAFLQPHVANRALRDLQQQLMGRGIRARVIYSGQRYLDVIPARTGKRAALRFLAALWGQDEATKILACGDSANDLDLLSAPETAGVVVGNASDPRLAALALHDDVYVAERPYAAGVLEGAEAFDFWSN